MADVNMKRFDTAPALGPFTLRDRAGRPVNLTNAREIKLHMATAAGVLKWTGNCTRVSPYTSGKVIYNWRATDLDTSGDFKWQVQVTWTNNKKTTYPTIGSKTLHVDPDFDAA